MSRPAGVGPLLRRWRESRHLSQLALGLEADVSSRHISFIETGRAAPSRAMLLTLSSVLDVPLRERNVLLEAAGFAPCFRETRLDDPRLRHVLTAVELILRQHEPRSAIAFDRHWDLVMVNAAFVHLLGLTMDEPPVMTPFTITTPPRPNLLHLLFRPDGMRRYHVNWDTIARSLLNDVHRALGRSRDPALEALLADLLAYPGVPASWREPDLDLLPAVALPFEMNLGGTLARFFSTITTLGKPQDVTLEELHIETFFPAD
ncbi:MAG TPA: helix-turn-helix transcriptional regulator [Candidatus Binatia bacterium]|jgi:transcriptional regulator with XRE-family HTH domain|nr:helix-turn-helix transcriptional regulator [Candidatus Binatia bacterium]